MRFICVYDRQRFSQIGCVVRVATLALALVVSEYLQAAPPTIFAQTPTAGSSVTSLSQVTVTFSENVQGVDAIDLRINGFPATSVQILNASTYQFNFPQPPYGAVAITWGSNHGITDTEPGQNPFEENRPESLWNYTLVAPTPPTITVTTTNDSGAGSLRQAILDANTNGGADVIGFNIPGTNSVFTIAPLIVLPAMNTPITIDGYTQPGASPNTLTDGNNAVLRIEISGTNLPAGQPGLSMNAPGCVVRGLVINRCIGPGIFIFAGGAMIRGNFIGTDASGTASRASGGDGINIQNVPNAVIGGQSPGDRNLLSGNSRSAPPSPSGIVVIGANATNTIIQGNYIGTDRFGTATLANNTGVNVYGARYTKVGGTETGAGNLISGNISDGVGISGEATKTLIVGNRIGTTANGLGRLGNQNGVGMFNTWSNSVGGTEAGAGNLISGNTNDGIHIIQATYGNVVQGNFIGTDISGTARLGNGCVGVSLQGPGSIVGGTNAGARNVIAANGCDGVLIGASSGTNNLVQGNFIGTDLTGTLDLGTDFNGIRIESGFNTIGGDTPGAGNLISGNNGEGIYINTTNAIGNVVRGNVIGMDVTGVSRLRNELRGLHILNGRNNVIGSTNPVGRNIITGNAGSGVRVDGGNDNQILGNLIGIDATGTNAIGNGGNSSGISIERAARTIIGGAPGSENTIGGHTMQGIHLYATATNTLVQGNWIGLHPNGTPLPNVVCGVFIDGGRSNRVVGNVVAASGGANLRLTNGPTDTLLVGNYIGVDTTGQYPIGAGPTASGISVVSGLRTIIGGSAPGLGNIIGGHFAHGIHIYPGATNTLIQGNWIGLHSNGNPIPNATNGVWIEGGLSNQIGGSLATEGNVIAYNGGDGIFVQSGTRHTITKNSIFLNGGLGIDLGTSGPTVNDANDADTGANNLQNFPVLVSAATDGGTLVSGTFNTAHLGNFTLDFYASAAPDPSGYGEGEIYIGSQAIGPTTNFNFTFAPSQPVPVGAWITGTATDAQGNTSEFSPAVQVFSTTVPGVLAPPTNRVVLANSNVTLTVVASGFQPLSYQWLFNGVLIGGATSPSLTLSQVQPQSAGNYNVIVQNAFGAVTSQVATLTVNVRPAFTSQPISQTVLAGANVTFGVTANGTLPMGFRWLKDGIIQTNLILGQPSSSFTVFNAQPADAGGYRVILSNVAAPSISSSIATLNVLSPPSVGEQPSSTNVLVGETATFCVAIGGTPPIRYQWRHNGASIVDATNACLVIANVQLTNGGTYNVVVENPAGIQTSSNAVLTISVPAAPPGDNFTNRVSLGSALTNAVSGTNRFATREPGEPLHAGKAGGKSVWYSWTAPANGIATFSTVGSTFDTLLAIYAGSTLTNLASIAADEDSGGFFTSRLQFNAQAGVTYQIAIDGFAGAEGYLILSWALEPTPEVLPVITAQPLSRTVLPGASTMFTAAASGSGLTYQWFFNGTLLSGQTSGTLTISNVQPENVGFYFVRVRNSAGRVLQSDDAILEIGPEPAVQSQDKFEDLFRAEAPQPFHGFAPVSIVSPGFLSLAAGVPLLLVVNNTNSTTESFEPTDCRISGSSRWMTMRVVENGVCLIDTIGSSLDTTLSVYTGSNYLTLQPVTCDDNGAPDGVRSLVRFPAAAGIDYRVRVDGVRALRGIIHVNAQLGYAPTIPPFVPTNPPVEMGAPLVLAAPPLTNIGNTLRYQWRLDARDLPDATNALYSIAALQASDAGQYSVRVWNEFDQVTQTVAVITLNIPYLHPALRMTNGSLRLTLQRPSLQSLALEGSDDLQTWSPVHTIPITVPGPAIDLPLTNLHRFYRARPWP